MRNNIKLDARVMAMRIVFIGNHTTGVRTLQVLMKHCEVVGVVAHPEDPEDGVQYESVFEFAKSHQLNAVRMNGKDPKLEEFVQSLSPDLLWVTDYRYLLFPAVFTIAPLGSVNLHGSLLPKYRGRAVNNWAILNGETQLGLTAHFIDEGVDTGDIIEQLSYELSEDEDAGDALEKLYPLFEKITETVIQYFLSGTVPRIPQDNKDAACCPRRTPADGIINWQKPARDIFNLIRAVARPYPGAWTSHNEQKLILWKAAIENEAKQSEAPGTIINIEDDGAFTVACSPGVLRVLDASNEDIPPKLSVGDILEQYQTS